MPNYPASLDSLANPTPTTLRDAPGFSLAEKISTLNDIVEALEAKLGIGSSTPVADTVLRATATGVSGYGTVSTAMLAANAATQVTSAVVSTSNPATTSASYGNVNDMATSLTTVGGPLLVVATGTFYNTAGTEQNATFGLALDGAAEVAEGIWTMPISSKAIVMTMLHLFTGVSAGSHEVRWRWKTAGGTLTGHTTLRRQIMVELKR